VHCPAFANCVVYFKTDVKEENMESDVHAGRAEKFVKEEDEDFVQLLPCEEYVTVQSNGHTSVVKEHQLVEPSTSEDSTRNVNKEKTFDEVPERSRSSHSERGHSCNFCGKMHQFQTDLKIHIMSIHTGEKLFSCNICEKKFLTNHNRKKHERRHMGELPVSDRSRNRNRQCDICGKKYRFPRDLKKHMELHTGEKQFTCSFCGKMHRFPNDLKIHIMRIHTGEKPFGCSFCGKKFVTSHQCNMHERGHKGQLPECPVCGGRYLRLHAHMLIHSENNYKHICSVCKKAFWRSDHLRKHMLVHTGEKPYTCNDCGGHFRTGSHLKTHMAVHIKERNYGPCNICGKMFSSSIYLKSHMHTHSEERPYHCDTCGKAFKLKITLKAHQVGHSSEKRFVCSTCGKQFRQDAALRRHKLIHTGEQPYECSACGMRFNQSSSMKRHMLVHTGEKPYSCSDCGERFTQSGGLNGHRRRHCPVSKNSQS